MMWNIKINGCHALLWLVSTLSLCQWKQRQQSQQVKSWTKNVNVFKRISQHDSGWNQNGVRWSKSCLCNICLMTRTFTFLREVFFVLHKSSTLMLDLMTIWLCHALYWASPTAWCISVWTGMKEQTGRLFVSMVLFAALTFSCDKTCDDRWGWLM